MYNYLFARQKGGSFILRLEDTDQSRLVEGAEKYITESLKWAGIEHDEGPDKGGPFGPYRQSERKGIYRDYAQKLVEEGHAYYAFDTSDELEEMRERMKKAGKPSPKYDHVTRQYMKNSLTLSQDEVQKKLDTGDPYVIRLKVPRKEGVKLKDIVRGWVSVESEQIDDKVLLKAGGMPTYHMANVVDDHLMKITHVIRGEEWLPSAPLHVLLYRFLGWEEKMPEFAHLPLILKPDGKGKLSKRDGKRGGFPVAAIEWEEPGSGEVVEGYREAGYFPEAFDNILALLGWSPPGNEEIFTKDELIRQFSLERVGKAGAKFDPAKAKWINQQFLRKMPNHELAGKFRHVLKVHGIDTGEEYLEMVCGLVKEKASFITEFWELGRYFFVRPSGYDEKVIRKRWNEKAPEFFKKFRDALEQAEEFTASYVEALFKKTADNMGEKPGKFMQLFRVVITGVTSGPALFEVAELLGKKEVLARVDQALEKIPQDVAN